MNRLGKHEFSRDSFLLPSKSNSKDRKLFSDQMNRNHFDQIIGRRDWSCSTTENLRCLNSAVNEIIQ